MENATRVPYVHAIRDECTCSLMLPLSICKCPFLLSVSVLLLCHASTGSVPSKPARQGAIYKNLCRSGKCHGLTYGYQIVKDEGTDLLLMIESPIHNEPKVGHHARQILFGLASRGVAHTAHQILHCTGKETVQHHATKAHSAVLRVQRP